MSTADSLPPLPKLEPMYTVEDVALALSRSERWVTEKMKELNPEHYRVGNSPRFTVKQYEAFRDEYIVLANPKPITTGRKKS